MKFLGVPIFSTAPKKCNYEECDCPEHGFGIGQPRARYIADAISAHADLARNQQTGEVDYERFMAGPEIELFTAAEVLFAGYCLDRNSIALRQWSAANTESPLREMLRKARAAGTVTVVEIDENGPRIVGGEGDSAAGLAGKHIFNFGQTGPVQD